VKLLKILAFGAVGYACFFFPILLGLFGFWLCRLLGLSSYASKMVGTALFSICPMLLMGHALASARAAKLKPKSVRPESDGSNVRELPSSAYDQIIEIWKTSIDVQQHFNGLELQIRNFAVTLLVAILGATAFALKEHYVVSIFGSTFSLAVAICLAGVAGLLGFYFMDRHWYHRLLIGSVKQTIAIERTVRSKVPELSLSQAIGDESPLFWGPFEIHSSEKIDIFYSLGLAILVLLAWVLLLADNNVGQTIQSPPSVASPAQSEGTLIHNYVIGACNKRTNVSSPRKKKEPAPCQNLKNQ
jgi:hypothetical protein